MLVRIEQQADGLHAVGVVGESTVDVLIPPELQPSPAIARALVERFGVVSVSGPAPAGLPPAVWLREHADLAFAATAALLIKRFVKRSE